MKDKITYTPGRLAKKLGVSKSKLMNHLRKTGLIDQCWLTERGYWQIPYNIAVRISSAEALAVSTPVTRQIIKEPRQLYDDARQFPSPEIAGARGLSQKRQDVQYHQPDYAQIGRTLQKAGITMTGFIKYIEQQMGGAHEQTQNNSAKRDKAQTDESPSTGSTGPDISDSSSEQ